MLSGELKYFAIFLSVINVLPPNPKVLPETLCIGNITRPLKKSNCLSSFDFTKPTFSKYSNLYPFSKAAFVKSSLLLRQYPN